MAFRRALLRAAWGAGLSVALAGASALAEEPDAGTRLAARELAMTGAEAFDRRDYATALDSFQRAEALYRVPSISLMTARCLARVGRVVEAVDKYEETSRIPLGPSAPEAFLVAVAAAKTEMDATRARLARLQLRLPADAPAGAEVRLDDKPVPRALLGVLAPVDPGPHRVTAHAPGREPFAYEVTLAEGAQQAVEISLARRSSSAAPAQGAAPADTRAAGGPSTLTWTLLGAGGVGLAVGTVAGVVALNRKSSLDAACDPGCPANMASDIDSFRMNRTLSYIGFGVGAAAAGAGVYLLLSQSKTSEVGAFVLPNGAAVRGRF